MKKGGHQKGRPTKWVSASMQESLRVGKPGVTFEIWTKWKKRRRKLGNLVVSVGGLRWGFSKMRRRSWNDVKKWFETP
jgi:hypothetical protein